jgi:hypothetical protein
VVTSAQIVQKGRDTVDIKVTLRNGNEYLLIPGTGENNMEGLFTELAAGRSQALRGWVAVASENGDRIVVRGDEIVELHLVEGD